MDEKEYVELRGTVEQIVFSNEENGYAVLRLLSQELSVRANGLRFRKVA